MKFETYIRNTKFKTSKPYVLREWNQFNKDPRAPVVKAMTDSEGIRKAYQHGDYHVFGDSLYIAGSWTAKDWYDDFTKIPFWGDTRNATRYIEAEKALKANPQIKTVVGHSLGGAVALELQKQHPYLKSRTYGSPTFDPFGVDNAERGAGYYSSKSEDKVQRFRSAGDPFSFFDASAQTSIDLTPFNSYSLTHDYSKLGQQFTTEEIEQPEPN